MSTSAETHPHLHVPTNISAGHTVLWLVGILVVLWLFGHGFRKVRL